MEGKMKKQDAEEVLGNLVAALEMLERSREFALIIPEVRSNLVYALPDATTPDDVAGIDGRITVVHGFPRAAGLPHWGASGHVARLLLEARKRDPALNAAINFKYDDEIIEVVRKYCEECGHLFGSVDRTNEPEEVARIDGHSAPWKVSEVVARFGGVPRLFYEGPGWGKEPLFYALGSSATGVVTIVIEIARRCKKRMKGQIL
jgi:hydroxymethylpyrimidine/phosphomethylpyrimidine kinase